MTRTRRHWMMTIACVAATLLGGGSLFAQEVKPQKATPTPTPDRRFFPERPGRGPERRPEGRPEYREGGQEQREGRRPFPPPPEPSFWFVSSEGRFGGKTVKGAPYSAVTETETIQTLADGSRIIRKTTANVYRDSEGRTRREQTLHNIGPFASSRAAGGDAPQIIFINDPVAGVNYTLDPRNRTARKMTLRGGPPPPPMQRPPQSSSEAKREAKTEAKTESLGKQTIEGVEAEGTRSTFTIPAGQIGNERALEIVSERWYSPALQEVVLSKHLDPRLGEHIYRLKNINRSEPARALFEVPADYTISEGKPFGGPGRGGMRRHDDDEQ